MIEFYIDEFRSEDDGIHVPGLVFKGTVKTGAIFDAILTKHDGSQDFAIKQSGLKLSVKSISAYGYPTEELPEGMGGELILESDQLIALVPGDILTNRSE